MDGKKEIFESLECPIKNIIDGDKNEAEKLKLICSLLRDNIAGYDWVGFYFVNVNKQNELILGPYSGDATDHTSIPFGRGVCGRVADTKQYLIVDDVCEESNYLSCSAFVKSEIVVPIISGNTFIGEIDIDSHDKANFDEYDLVFLEWVANVVINVAKSYMENLKNG